MDVNEVINSNSASKSMGFKFAVEINDHEIEGIFDSISKRLECSEAMTLKLKKFFEHCVEQRKIIESEYQIPNYQIPLVISNICIALTDVEMPRNGGISLETKIDVTVKVFDIEFSMSFYQPRKLA